MSGGYHKAFRCLTFQKFPGKCKTVFSKTLRHEQLEYYKIMDNCVLGKTLEKARGESITECFRLCFPKLFQFMQKECIKK